MDANLRQSWFGWAITPTTPGRQLRMDDSISQNPTCGSRAISRTNTRPNGTGYQSLSGKWGLFKTCGTRRELQGEVAINPNVSIIIQFA